MYAVTIVDKSTLRAALLTARRAVPDDVRVAEAEALRGHLGKWSIPGTTVCGYVPVGTEPGSVGMLDSLLRRGLRVLLPVTSSVPAPLAWGEYRPGALVAARFGLLEPAGPALPAATLADAALVLIPALAVDRRGVRLGRGAGYYDRSLTLRNPRAQLVAVVRDAELVDKLPAEPHDVSMTHALTPQHGVLPLPTGMPTPT